ncbi:antA/AntB antirepressor family protein [Enterobacter ludwigii]
MTTQLIPVFDGSISNEKTLLCDARELHLFLGLRKDFSSWIRERVADYGFIENEDFILLTNLGEQRKGRGGHNRKDYHLTIDTAKELAMVERNEKGRQIRRYFIECEKQLRLQATAPTYPPISDDYANRTEMIYYQNFKPVLGRILKPGEIVMSHDEIGAWLEKKGLLLFTREELRRMTVTEIAQLAR